MRFKCCLLLSVRLSQHAKQQVHMESDIFRAGEMAQRVKMLASNLRT